MLSSVILVMFLCVIEFLLIYFCITVTNYVHTLLKAEILVRKLFTNKIRYDVVLWLGAKAC